MPSDNEFDVIVIDDEVSVTQIFQQYILWRYKHWRFMTFTNPMNVYEAITKYHLSAKVWIVDIMMPLKNGMEIAEAIRQQNGEKPVVLAYSALDRRAFETDDAYQRGLKYFNHFINKKEDFSSILSLVEVWVGNTSSVSSTPATA
jgi:DNA-binding NtrC family response regulator